MSKKYIFEGYSDDTFGEYGITSIDHDDGASGSVRYFTVSRPDGEGVLITGQYNSADVWHIGMSLLDEDKPLNKDEWQIYFEPNEEAAYRNRMIVDAPDDTELQRVADSRKRRRL